MSQRYTLNGEEFMWVTPSVALMNSKMLSSIVNSDQRQLVVSLKTGLLTTHKYPPKKEIPASVAIYYHYEGDTYIKLSHDVEDALKRVAHIYTTVCGFGEVIVKHEGVKINLLGNWTNFERSMRKLYNDLAEEA
jgi:hypothetical protein